MLRIRAHLPTAIKHNLRWIWLFLIAVLPGLTSITPSHAAIRPATDNPELHTSRDGMFRQAVARVVTAARQTTSAALPLHKVRAGESISSVAVNACHGKADMWTGIYAASRSAHLTGYNANVLNVGQLLAINCVYLPGELRYAISAPRHVYQTVAVLHYGGGGGGGGGAYGKPYFCGDGDGDGYDVSCASIGRGGSSGGYRSSGHAYRAVTVYRGSSSRRYSGSGSFERCVIARESGGNSQVMNASGHYGLYQFSSGTWRAYGGSSGSFGHASVGEQRRVFLNAIAQGGQSNWSPYDGCLPGSNRPHRNLPAGSVLPRTRC